MDTKLKSGTPSWLSRLILGALVLTALFALAGSALFSSADYTFAQEGAQSAELLATPSTEPSLSRHGHGNGEGHIVDHDTIQQAIATTLGMTVEELQAAHDAGESVETLAEARGIDPDLLAKAVYDAQLVALEAAVSAGTLTQIQADEMRARFELHYLERLVIDHDVIHQVVADTLGISVEELNTAHQNHTHPEALANGEVTREMIQAAVEAKRTELIDAAVANGTLTQAQAEQLLNQAGMGGHGMGGHGRDMDGQGMNGHGRGMDGHGGGRGRGHGGHGQNNNSDAVPTTPATESTSADA